MVVFVSVYVLLGMNCFRPCLNNKKFSGAHVDTVPVLGPFNIHRLEESGLLAVMLFNNACPFRKFQDFIFFKNIAVSFGQGGCDISYGGVIFH